MGLPFLIAAAELQDGTQRTQALEFLDWVVWKRMYLRVGDFATAVCSLRLGGKGSRVEGKLG